MPKSTTKKQPGKWKPLDLYEHQQAVVDAYARGIRRFFLPWHRRAGKDVFGLDFGRERAFERVGNYWHMFPFHTQARRAIWKGIDARTGERFIDRAFPPIVRESINDTDMSITLTNGSVWQMLGSDNYDRHVGANPCGLLFSEWSLCDPAAWDYFRPILMENHGWAGFITTFRGRNHAYRMYETIKDSEGWYVDLRTVDDTKRHDGAPIVTKEDIEKEIRDGMDPALVQQEFYCNPDAAATGAIFNRQYTRLMDMECEPYSLNNRVIRIAWGTHDKGLAATCFQENHVIGVHKFCESNMADAIQTVVRRYPHAPIVHHAFDPDPTLFSEFDGAGVVATSLSRTQDLSMQHGVTAAFLNTCRATALARETLADFAMAYAPYRNAFDDTDMAFAALSQSLAIAKSAQPIWQPKSKPVDYRNYDRGII